jgi:hypothetical protein
MAVVCAFTVSLVVAWNLLRFAGGDTGGRLPMPASLLSTTDTITIWLGLLGVLIALASLVVTGAGVGVAILAIFGYQAFKEMIVRAEKSTVAAARKVSDTVARRAVDKYLKGDDFNTKIKEIGSQVNWSSGTVTTENIAPLGSQLDQTSIARKYPPTQKKEE